MPIQRRACDTARSRHEACKECPFVPISPFPTHHGPRHLSPHTLTYRRLAVLKHERMYTKALSCNESKASFPSLPRPSSLRVICHRSLPSLRGEDGVDGGDRPALAILTDDGGGIYLCWCDV